MKSDTKGAVYSRKTGDTLHFVKLEEGFEVKLGEVSVLFTKDGEVKVKNGTLNIDE